MSGINQASKLKLLSIYWIMSTNGSRKTPPFSRNFGVHIFFTHADAWLNSMGSYEAKGISEAHINLLGRSAEEHQAMNAIVALQSTMGPNFLATLWTGWSPNQWIWKHKEHPEEFPVDICSAIAMRFLKEIIGSQNSFHGE